MTCQMTCFCDVSLSWTMRSLVVDCGKPRDLLVSHARASHLFDGKEFLCGQDQSRCENAYKHLGFGSNVAMVYGLVP